MWTLVFPVDTIKSSLQASSTPTTLPAVVRQLHAKGGFGAFFPGLGPALMRSFPANAATFLGVEVARNGLDVLFESQNQFSGTQSDHASYDPVPAT